MARHADHHFARLSNSELDLILRFDPEVRPDDDPQVKLAEFRHYINTVQSIVDDSLETW